MKINLVIHKFGSVRQYHVLHFGWAVSCGQSQAPQGVATCSVVTDYRHDLFLDRFAEGNFAVANSYVSAPLNNSLRGPLWGREEERNIHSMREDCQTCQILMYMLLSVYLDKHLAHGRTIVGGAVNGHGLSVSGEFQGELLSHQLLDHLIRQRGQRVRKSGGKLQRAGEGAGVTHRVAGVGSVDLGQAVDVGVKDVHLLHQTGQCRLCGFTDLLVHTLHLKHQRFMKLLLILWYSPLNEIWVYISHALNLFSLAISFILKGLKSRIIVAILPMCTLL